MPAFELAGQLTGVEDAGCVDAVAEGEATRARIEVVNEDHAVSLQKEDADMAINAILAMNLFSSAPPPVGYSIWFPFFSYLQDTVYRSMSIIWKKHRSSMHHSPLSIKRIMKQG